MKILITGAAGSLGTALSKRLRADGQHPIETDITTYDGNLDVTDAASVMRWARTIEPDVIFHLAAAKHAPEGELEPGRVAHTNLYGTRNIVSAAQHTGARVILVSTCKACNPETAYGASKLVAERLVLNAGGTVLRFFNVPESSRNVFRLWESLPDDEPIPWTNCWRYFVSMSQAIDLCVRAMTLPPGRYAPDPGEARHMDAVAAELYPGRQLVEIPRRRGDRDVEPLCASSETVYRADGLLRITCAHDAVEHAEAVAA